MAVVDSKGIENLINILGSEKPNIENFMHKKACFKINTTMKRHYIKSSKMIIVCFIL